MKWTNGKTISQGGVLLNFIGRLMRVGLALMKNILTPLTKSVLIPLSLAAVASATEAAIQKKIYGWEMTTLVTSNKINERYCKNS